MDETFVVIKRDQVPTFKERRNSVFPDIQLTMEEEENKELAFLDVLVCHKDSGGLKTKVFRKATNMMQVLNYNSNHPICTNTVAPLNLHAAHEVLCCYMGKGQNKTKPNIRIASEEDPRRNRPGEEAPWGQGATLIAVRDPERPPTPLTAIWRTPL
ncbi:unnamed protein product [Dibothriocephalus latus]|uniref:Uncharacterized protein n=1 Tax=Dibothriocephalus latus TaxID=60516 RepID=A0A3P7P370_DIBLA|nr:unnamed protein product [Dibothriocephalus latus]